MLTLLIFQASLKLNNRNFILSSRSGLSDIDFFRYCLMIMYNIFKICIVSHQISVAERSSQWASDLMIVGSYPSLDFCFSFHSKMRQYLKKSMSDEPERDDRIKLQLINFSEQAAMIFGQKD